MTRIAAAPDLPAPLARTAPLTGPPVDLRELLRGRFGAG